MLTYRSEATPRVNFMSNLPWYTSWSFATSWTSASSNRLWRRSTL